MDALTFSIRIDASPARVWESLWSDAGYRHWTAAFCEGSYVETDWQQGSPVRFLAPGGSGMYSTIEKRVANEQLVFLHHGEIKEGIAQPPAAWAGARERYRLSPDASGTLLEATLDANEQMAAYFNDTFPKALARLKKYAEASPVVS
jgi:uncharacterized protein YndB with AHSA1/START domain